MKKALLTLSIIFSVSLTQAQIDRSQQPPSGPTPPIEIGDPQKVILDNGLTLLVVENHKLPQVSISLRMDRPLIPEKDKIGTSSLLSAMMGKGSKNIPKDAFEAEIDFMGAQLSFTNNGAYANSLTRYFPRVFELLAEATLYPHFLEEEFKKEKDKTLEGLKANEKSVTTAARRVENLVSYGATHPYGEFLTEQKVSDLSLTDVKDKYNTLYHASNSYLVVVGDVVFDAVVELAKQHFGQWKAEKIDKPNITINSNPPTTSLHYVDMPNAVQSEIAIANLASLTRKNPDYFPVLIANQILGGGSEARLFQNLREDKGYTYGSYSSFRTNHKTKSQFKATSSVRNAVADSAVIEMLHEIHKLAREPITKEELELVKAKYAGAFILSLEDPELIANFAYNVITQNLDKDFYRNFLKNVNAVTSKDVQRVAKDYFLAEQARIFVTGKGREILEGLENISFEGKKIPISYHDKFGVPIGRPNYEATAPEGITAPYVIKQHIKAIGGLDQLNNVHSLKTSYSGEVQGTTLSMETTKTNKNEMVVELKLMGNTMQKMVVNQNQGYMMMQGQKMDLEGDMLTQAIEDAKIFPELSFNLESLELMGETDLNGIKAYEVKVSDHRTLFYNAENFYKIQSTQTISMGGQTQTTITKYSNHKETNGIVVPNTVIVSMGPQEINLSLDSISLNDAIDPGTFE